jgi:hypothetical protein
VIAYQGDGSDGSSNGILARQFDSNGVPLSTELQVNSYTTGSQMAAAVSLDASGDFVIAWHGSGAGDSDTGIFAQRFRSPAVLDIDGNGVVDPLTDGVLALRREFGFTGGTLVTGAVGPNCTRCDAPSIEAYLQPLL